jgi:hypothetical protein
MKYAILLFLLPYAAYSQKIETDPFTKDKRVETKYVFMKPSGFLKNIRMKFRSAGNDYFVLFNGSGWGVGTIGTMDPFMFLLDNDSTVKVYPTDIQSYEIGSQGNYYNHQYRIDREQVEMLSRHSVVKIRKYYSSNYDDMDVPEKNQSKIKELSVVFLQSLNY